MWVQRKNSKYHIISCTLTWWSQSRWPQSRVSVIASEIHSPSLSVWTRTYPSWHHETCDPLCREGEMEKNDQCEDPEGFKYPIQRRYYMIPDKYPTNQAAHHHFLLFVQLHLVQKPFSLTLCKVKCLPCYWDVSTSITQLSAQMMRPSVDLLSL